MSHKIRHFVHYHNSHKMKYSVSSIPTPRLFTDKNVKELPENTESPKNFYLAAAFQVSRIRDDYEHPDFKYSAHGIGSIYGETILLNGELWFDFFKKEQQNFRFSLTEITDDTVVKHFQRFSGYSL